MPPPRTALLIIRHPGPAATGERAASARPRLGTAAAPAAVERCRGTTGRRHSPGRYSSGWIESADRTDSSPGRGRRPRAIPHRTAPQTSTRADRAVVADVRRAAADDTLPDLDSGSPAPFSSGCRRADLHPTGQRFRCGMPPRAAHTRTTAGSPLPARRRRASGFDGRGRTAAYRAVAKAHHALHSHTGRPAALSARAIRRTRWRPSGSPPTWWATASTCLQAMPEPDADMPPASERGSSS